MKNKFLRLAVLIFLMAGSGAYAQIITTIAGNDTAGYNGDNIPAVSAELHDPNDVAFDGAGNVYIADGMNNRIRKINSAGIITTFAGTGTGGYNGDNMQATAAELNYPTSITFDASGSMYITDDYNYRIRKINTTGIITTIAGAGTSGFSGDNGMATLAKIGSCSGIVLDKSANIYIDEGGYNHIRKISNSGVITTIAGDGAATHSGDNGPATAAAIMEPIGLAIDGTGNIYFAEYSGSRIRKISISGIITTIVGTGATGYSGDGGLATAAELYHPSGVSIDNEGNFYISDAYSSVIRKVNTMGIISTIAGTGDDGFSGDGGPATLAQLKSPSIARVDASGNIYIADWRNNRIRYIKSTTFVNKVNNTAGGIKIYPNPCRGTFTVNVSSGIDEPVKIFVANVVGEKIKGIDAITNDPVEVHLDVPAGIYLISAATTNDKWNGKVIVSR